MRNIKTREGYDLWDKAHALPRFNFWRGGEDEKGSVIRVPEKHGNWVHFDSISNLADEYQDEINILRGRLAEAERYVQKMIDCSQGQDSIATGYLSEILDVIKGNK